MSASCTTESQSKEIQNLSDPSQMIHDDLSTEHQDPIIKIVQNSHLISKATHIPPSVPISGRIWKNEFPANKRSFSTNAAEVLHTSWECKQTERARRKEIQMQLTLLKQQRELKLAQERERVKKAREMRAVNALKNVEYQVIKDTRKLRKMSKAQFKNFRKLADINKW